MGKVKDGAPASKTSKPSKGGPAGGNRRRFVQFLENLVRVDLYKPKQGWYARVWTAGALGLVVAVGLYKQFYALEDNYRTITRFTIPAVLGVILGWFIYRLVMYPPFVEFLIATEAEMNKVSWTSQADLYRATTVVLTTVALMAVFLFGVDWVWSNLLQMLGVLRFGGGGSFGSTG
jgi:preprotein translocase subunit SecE